MRTENPESQIEMSLRRLEEKIGTLAAAVESGPKRYLSGETIALLTVLVALVAIAITVWTNTKELERQYKLNKLEFDYRLISDGLNSKDQTIARSRFQLLLDADFLPERRIAIERIVNAESDLPLLGSAKYREQMTLVVDSLLILLSQETGGNPSPDSLRLKELLLVGLKCEVEGKRFDPTTLKCLGSPSE